MQIPVRGFINHWGATNDASI